jgi:hypothetical protein
MLNSATLAAILLIAAGIIHNYSFMCRKLKPAELKVFYPVTALGKLFFDLIWIVIATCGLYLTYQLSATLCAVAAVIYFLLLPFVLQPPLAKLLGFASLTDYVQHIDQSNSNGD